jgi:SAM-dependent methyltransferase
MNSMPEIKDRKKPVPGTGYSKERIIQSFEPGSSTAVPSNVTYRLGKIRDLGLLSGKWLDFGCASGRYTVALVEAGAESAVGIDTQEDRIAEARALEQAHPVKFQHVADATLPLSGDFFHGVLLNEVLEHVTDEIQTLREIRRVLRSEGYLVIMSPNRWFPFEGHGMRIGRRDIDVPIPLLPWIPASIGRHFMRARNYWPGELRDLIRNEGFTIQVTGFVFPMFEVYPWLPGPLISRYRKLVPLLEKFPFIRRFGVSNFIVAQKLCMEEPERES